MSRPVIGVLINEFDGSYQRALLAGLRRAARELGMHLLCFPGRELAAGSSYDRDFNLIYAMAAQTRLDGILSITGSFTWTISPQETERFFRFFDGVPVVSIGPGMAGMPCVRGDNVSGMGELVDHFLLDHGFRRIAFICGPGNNVDAQERLQVFLDCHARAGVAVDERLLLPGRFYHVSGREAVDCLVSAGLMPEAIIAANDEMALAAISALHGHGLRVPEDVAVAGFDDLCAQVRLSPPLSSVRQDAGEQARRGLETLLQLLRGEAVAPETVQASRAILRHSCGCSGLSSFHPAHGTIWEREATREASLSELRLALLEDVADPAHGSFQLVLARLADQALQGEAEPNDLRNALLSLHREVLTMADVQHRQQAGGRLLEALAWLGENERMHMTDDLLARFFPHWILPFLMRMNLPSSEGRVRTMLRLLRDGLADFGVRNAYLVLYPAVIQSQDWWDCELPVEGQLVLALRDGAPLVAGEFERFPIRDLLPVSVFHRDAGAIYAVLPLFARSDHYGYMLLDIEHPFSVRIESLREAISHLVTSTLVMGELERARDMLRQDLDRAQESNQVLAVLAEQDELTGLLNRRGFFARANALRLGRHEPLMLISADMDGLKRINDEFGHAAGDAAIRDMATLLRATFRSDDLVARLGGDEFVVLSRRGAPGVEGMVRARLETRLHEYNTASRQAWGLAVSLGFTEVPADDTMELSARLVIADRWLYDEKRRRKAARAATRMA